MQNERAITTDIVAAEKIAAKLPAVLALMFGVFLIYGAAFAQSSTIHNAAHDSRHAITVPCH